MRNRCGTLVTMETNKGNYRNRNYTQEKKPDRARHKNIKIPPHTP